MIFVLNLIKCTEITFSCTAFIASLDKTLPCTVTWSVQYRSFSLSSNMWLTLLFQDSGYIMETSSEENFRRQWTKRKLAFETKIKGIIIIQFCLCLQQLDSVYSDVKAMNECCQDMTNRLKVFPHIDKCPHSVVSPLEFELPCCCLLWIRYMFITVNSWYLKVQV